MRLLLTCSRPHPASTVLARSSLIRHIPNHLAAAMATSPKKQVKLDAFVNHNDKGDGSSKGKAIDITGSTTSAFASSSVSSTSNGKGKSRSTAATKRPRDDGTDVPAAAKRSKANGTYRAFPNGTPDPPEDTVEGLTSILAKLEEVQKKAKPVKHKTGGTLLYWMRMKDLRLKDNKALSLASEAAQKYGKNLVILHVLSPSDYKAHDRAPVRIDFVLRNLALLQQELDTYNIPLALRTYTKRKTIPSEVNSLAKEWSASHIFANLEYEVDELRRDIQLCELAQEQDDGPEVILEHDYLLSIPGKVMTPKNRPYSVFSPFHRAWSALLLKDLDKYSKEYPLPKANQDSIRTDQVLGKLFEDEVPDKMEGFELPSQEYADRTRGLYPAGTEVAEQILRKFTHNKAKKGGFLKSAAENESPEDDLKNSRLQNYSSARNFTYTDGTSRLSPYLAAGIISIRACLRAVLALNNNKLPMTRETGSGSFVQELCFRDFYQHVMVHWPRVSMGRNFILKYEAVQWDDDPDEVKLNAWKEGKTGYPFIDAGMRQMAQQGWMHNRARMAVGSFLVKDLMINWKEGERFFSRSLIDGDLGANNGGWEWIASCGTDPQPYFRIFNPTSQSEKFDPDGDYIRAFIPELRNVKGKAIHEPHKHLKISEFKATGYPKPIVDHAKARKKAIARFKNPGTTADE